MNKLFLSKLLLISTVFSLFNFSNLVNAEFKVSNTTGTNLDLSWDPIENVFIYKIEYWLESSAVVAYEQKTDYIDSNSYTIFDLKPSTKYYLSLIWYDENGKEVYKSKELSATTVLNKTSTTKSPLSLEDAKLVLKDKIELSFTNEIKNTSNDEREFRIENIKDSSETLNVIDSVISEKNKNNLILTLDKEPKIGEEYKVVVLNIRDLFEQNIEFWVDSEATFIGKEITEEDIVSFNSASENKPENNVNNSLTGSTVDTWNLTWVELNSADVGSSVLSASDDTSKLPATWPTQILVFILAFVLSSIVFVYKFKKS